MYQCPVCQTEYIEGEVSCCFVCNWDLTPCPETFVERQNVYIAWAREIWIKFQTPQKQLSMQIDAEIDANLQLSQLREESDLEAWNLLVSWVSTVDLNAAIYGLDLLAPDRKLEVLTAFGIAFLGEQAIKAGIDWLKCGIIPGKVISAGAKGLMIYAIGKAACLFYEAKVNQHVNHYFCPKCLMN